ncbi:solute carrier family 23 member 3 isoform X1 [Mustela putorius furo]|uniref:Solute carrier family 23 member 3 isoform X1 n=3 Tax=Mustela putorius furo TaxID=9669 RepID=A0A8U0NZF7_MUSPF|nr:solute carrier family 23 member 3 isoform X1 [Mustela putorius furo]
MKTGLCFVQHFAKNQIMILEHQVTRRGAACGTPVARKAISVGVIAAASRAAKTSSKQGSMSRSSPHPTQLQSMGPQNAPVPLLLPPPLPPPPPDVQNPSSHPWASQCGPPPWGLSCLLALQHILVLASLLWASHLLLLPSLPPGELSYSPAQLLASSLFSCGVSTTLQVWIGSSLPCAAPVSGVWLPWPGALEHFSQRGVWGCGGIRAAPRHPGAVGGAWPLVPPLWTSGAGTQPDGGRLLCPQGGGLLLLYSLGPGLTAYPARGGLFSAPGLLPVTPLPLEASFKLFPSSSHSHLPAPLGMWWSGGGPVDERRTGIERLLSLLPLASACPSKLAWKVLGGGALSCLSLAAQVLMPAACVWIISALLGLHIIPLELSASLEVPWVWLPHPAEWDWPLLTPRALAAGISMALAASASSLGCYALCGRLLQLPSPPPHACSRGLSLEGLGSVLAGLLGSPMGTASSFPNVGTVSLIQTGSRRVVYLVGLFCVGLGLSPRLAQLLTAIPLPVLGGVLGVTQAVVLSAGFSSFHLADIDSGRNVFIVGFSIFMALLLPRWLREAPVLLSTGWSPLDVLLRSVLTEPIFLAGFLGFLLENTIPGTRLERGLGQGLQSPFTAQEAQLPQKSREKAAKEYELPFPTQNLRNCIPQPLHCLCPLPEDHGNEEGGPSEPGETADLLPGFAEQCPESSQELGSQ